jgi:hypothetical protein
MVGHKVGTRVFISCFIGNDIKFIVVNHQPQNTIIYKLPFATPGGLRFA